MNGTEERQRKRFAHVALRPCDVDAIDVILAYMRGMGILVGRGSTSDAVRFALEYTAGAATAIGLSPRAGATG